jgi:hypothetical protein
MGSKNSKSKIFMYNEQSSVIKRKGKMAVAMRRAVMSQGYRRVTRGGAAKQNQKHQTKYKNSPNHSLYYPAVARPPYPHCTAHIRDT